MVDGIKKNLTNIVVVIGLVGSIGAGFAKYGELTQKIKVLEAASKKVDKVSIEMVAVLQEKVKALENVDTSHSHSFIEHDHPVEHSHTKTLVNEKQIELLQVQIEEIKVSTSNPLSQ
tara:strand:- start:151 stop:501 length:351 start_codon:yes stop_codon:yes gene_type:complete